MIIAVVLLCLNPGRHQRKWTTACGKAAGTPHTTSYRSCFVHAWMVHRQIDELLTENPPTRPAGQPLVYYLALSPTTVKIGTTTNLPQRLTALRSEMQYVLAVEPGGRDVERMRHQQFAAERIGRREDFRVSDALQDHIASLNSTTESPQP